MLYLPYPMALVVLHIFILGIFNFRTRKAAIVNGSVKLGYYKVYDSKFDAPEYLVRVGRHYDNQFQLPMLFLITALMAVHFNVPSILAPLCGWGFLASRLAHSYVHLGSNHVLKRAAAFGLGWVFVLILWVLILIQIHM